MTYTAADIKKGLGIVMGILGTIVALNVVRFGLNLATGHAGLFSLLVLAFQLWMCWAVYTGKLWARIFLSAGLLLQGVVMLGLGFSAGDGLTALFGFAALACGLSFWVIPAVNAYFEYVKAQVG